MARKPAAAPAPVEDKKTRRAAKTETAPAATETKAGPGRAVREENQARLDHILARTKEEPGILSAALAGELGITTLQCSQLTDRLVKAGTIEFFKRANGQRMNFLPKDLAKALPKLEKERDAEIEARANKPADNDRFAKLKEAKAAKQAAAKAAKAAEPAEKPARRRKAA